MSQIIILLLLTLFCYSALSCKKKTDRDLSVKPSSVTHSVSRANDNEYTEEEVKEFFKQQNLKTSEVVAKFGEPAIESKKRGAIQFDYIFDNFYKPKPSEGVFCGMTVYFDMDGTFLRYSPLY